MEISRDALLLVIKATRMSMKMTEAMEAFMIDKKSWTLADEVSAHLKDALFITIGEPENVEKNFEDSMTVRLLTSDMSDGAVADYIIMMNKIRKHIEQEEVQQPKPQIASKESMQKMYVQSGGYQYTPEGEFR